MADPINKNVYDYLSYVLSRLSSITRYSTRKFIIRQSVMEHIGDVALITLVLSEYLNSHGVRNDTSKAIKLALIHDVPEVISGDLPHDSKYNYGEVSEGLRRQLDSLERLTMDHALSKLKDRKMSASVYALFNEYNERSTIESKIVKLADFYDVILYTRQEMSLGNKSMQREYKNARQRFGALMKEIYRSGAPRRPA